MKTSTLHMGLSEKKNETFRDHFLTVKISPEKIEVVYHIFNN